MTNSFALALWIKRALQKFPQATFYVCVKFMFLVAESNYF